MRGSPISNIMSDRDLRKKMDLRSDERIFLCYSTNSRAFKVFNKRTKVFIESINVMINDDERVVSARDEDEVVITPSLASGDVLNGVANTSNDNEDSNSCSSEDEDAANTPVKKPSNRV